MNPPTRKRSSGRSPFYDTPSRNGAKSVKRGSFFGGIARFVLLIFIGGIAAGAGGATQGYLYFTHNLPSIESLRNYSPPVVTEVYSNDGMLIAEYARERRYVAPIEKIPSVLQSAFIAAEDKNFWQHSGVDQQAIARAIVDNLKGGRVVSGASTITQQLVKTLLLTSERKLKRKIKEAILARRIEQSFTKKQILFLYLNQIYLGSSAYGVEAAARIYFGRHVDELSVAECAMLAGLAKGPSLYSPKRNLKKALQRRRYVLGRMFEDGYITQEQHDQAVAETPKLVERNDPTRHVAPYYAEHVRRYIEKKYGTDALYNEGLKVYAAVDLKLTREAKNAVQEGLSELDRRQGYRGPIRTLNVKGVMEFLEKKTKERTEQLKFGDEVEGVITHIDAQSVYVRMGSYIHGEFKKEYVGRIRIDPNSNWWVRKPYVRTDLRTRNFAEGDLPFQVGDVILVRVIDVNQRRRELYLKKYGKNDPQMKNFKKYTEDMLEYFPLEPAQTPSAEVALMLRENRSGYVRVLLGGKDPEGQYNRATQAHRQPGSSFKPVIYAAALNKGFTCADIIHDSPLALTVPGTGEVWRPKNYSGGYSGPVTFRQALVKSKNIPTIKILQQIGTEQARAYAKKLGYVSPLAKNLTMALGSTGVSLEEQLNAYSVFPNRGYLVESVYVKKIVDRNGRIIEERHPPVLLDDPLQVEQPQIRQVSHDGVAAITGDSTELSTPVLRRRIDEGTAYIMSNLLQDVVQQGTATILKRIVGRKDIAGKTGTTNDNVDAWFMGFSPDYTCGVWVGFDDKVSLGAGETGGKAAAPIWGYFMKQALADKPEKEFPKTEAVEIRHIDPRSGLVASHGGGVEEVFKVGSAPREVDPGLIKGARWEYAGSDIDQF